MSEKLENKDFEDTSDGSIFVEGNIGPKYFNILGDSFGPKNPRLKEVYETAEAEMIKRGWMNTKKTKFLIPGVTRNYRIRQENGDFYFGLKVTPLTK